MDNSEQLIGCCPSCGETLHIPAHLKQFSCIYCGTRLTPLELTTKEKPVDSAAVDTAFAVDYYRSHILETITNHEGIDKEMTGARFAPAFEQYMQSNEEIFRQLDVAVTHKAITLEEAVNVYLDQLETRWNGQNKKMSRNMMLETDKFTIAIFLVPMVRKLSYSVSEEFCKILHEQWLMRYPKSPFQLGTYEELSGGFQKKYLGLCYITTAICSFEHKPDNCDELTAFRSFRDGYLRACTDGPDLIDEYYSKAPGIVLRIEMSADRDTIYSDIRNRYLLPCYNMIKQGNLQGCKHHYTTMMHELEQEFLN